MNRNFGLFGRGLSQLFGASILLGCAATAPAPIRDRGSAEEPTSVPEAPVQRDRTRSSAAPESTEPLVPARPQPPREQSPAVRQLLATAHTQMNAGNYEMAVATVERGIRIAPKDPRSWHQLAQVHFANGDVDQAKATALRSNALADASPRLIAANWFLIAKIERGKGDEAAAARALSTARAQLKSIGAE